MAILKIPVGPQDHATGPESAPVTLVEYGDYQCPYCGAAHPMVKQLQARFGDDLRFVFRNFPITELHPEAMNAASTAEFAAGHDRFWPVHDALYEHQRRLGAAFYEQVVAAQGLSPQDLESALAAGTYQERIRSDFNSGVRSGVNGTPTFFINGQRYDGALDVEDLAEVLANVIGERRSQSG
jgi:protein-disulfide isomerase